MDLFEAALKVTTRQDMVQLLLDYSKLNIRLTDERDEQKAEVKRITKKAAILEAFVRDVMSWRESCRKCDQDMGYEPRSFLDDEEWTRIEEQAAHALDAAITACEEGGGDASQVVG